MRAGRYACPAAGCKAPVGDACRRMSRGRFRRLKGPHASRIAITEPCPEHSRERGQVCSPTGPNPVCDARQAAVNVLLARPEQNTGAVADTGAVVDETHDFALSRVIADWDDAKSM